MKVETNQIWRKVDEVGIVLVNELYHGILQGLEVDVEILSQGLQLHMMSTVCYKTIHIKIILKKGKWKYLFFINAMLKLWTGNALYVL